MEIITATTDISKSEVQNKDVIIVGGSNSFGKSQLLFNMERNEKTVLERLRGDVHMGDFRQRVKGTDSFRYLSIVGGVPGAAKKRAKRKAEKKARKQSRK
jgi:hypothetical protein